LNLAQKIIKLHLVDGTYELFRNHFGAPPKTTPVQVTVTGAIGHRKFQYLIAPVTVTFIHLPSG